MGKGGCHGISTENGRMILLSLWHDGKGILPSNLNVGGNWCKVLFNYKSI